MRLTRWGAGLVFVAVAAFIAVGCNKEKGGDAKGKEAQVAQKGGQDHKDDAHKDEGQKKDTGHGWWCDEHGVPEHLCIMCNDTLTAKAKKEGDWCEHDKAKSQCFKCSPKQKEYYAKMYREKNAGKEPPPITEEEDDKKAKEKRQ